MKFSVDVVGPRAVSGVLDQSKPQPEATRIWGRILVIDDDPAIGQTISDALPEYNVTVVSAAGEAFARLVDDQRFDIILCDLMMPQLGGRDVLERLDAEWPDLAPRLIFITGGAFTTAAREFLKRAKQMVLVKPFSVDQLRTTIAMHLETRSRESKLTMIR